MHHTHRCTRIHTQAHTHTGTQAALMHTRMRTHSSSAYRIKQTLTSLCFPSAAPPSRSLFPCPLPLLWQEPQWLRPQWRQSLGGREGNKEKDKLPSWCRFLVWMSVPVTLCVVPGLDERPRDSLCRTSRLGSRRCVEWVGSKQQETGSDPSRQFA